ncbi:MAG: 16S rRNA (cytosine(967)-C(5))-methyltransferase RsmB [Acidiferrobacterales bacterium]|nr:16S rRNA (cytosine(967)-C(5))-methyltransferase RsmB [Acidiferrobacterales bacterium]
MPTEATKARAVAADIVAEVMHSGRLLDQALNAASARTPLIQELAYGTLRWAIQLKAIAARLLNKPLRAKDADVSALLLVGLYQLLYMRTQEYAAVSETVSAVTVLNKAWSRELINACLRRFLREKDMLLADISADPALASSHPHWLLRELQRDWPDHWRAILSANNERPPMALRVNRLKLTREQYLERLRAEGIEATALAHTDSAVVLARPLAVTALPGFTDGWVSVQDEAAQLAAALLDLQPGQRVLDACAAPGGKLGHMLERCPAPAEVVALDKEPLRLALVEQNLARLRLKARVLAADAGDPDAWWDGRVFDRILLDAPCSATGVIRRHPDIKLHRSLAEVTKLCAQQATILAAVWPLLARGGKLLYVTCSILAVENERQMRAFLTQHPDAAPVALSLPFALARDPGMQILPGQEGMDGFYYGCLQKG